MNFFNFYSADLQCGFFPLSPALIHFQGLLAFLIELPFALDTVGHGDGFSLLTCSEISLVTFLCNKWALFFGLFANVLPFRIMRLPRLILPTLSSSVFSTRPCTVPSRTHAEEAHQAKRFHPANGAKSFFDRELFDISRRF